MNLAIQPIADEDWPFVDREREMAKALAALSPQIGDAKAVKVLIRGDSGCGKSFFTKELVKRFAQCQPDAVTVYVEVPAGDFDAADLKYKVASRLTKPRRATRSEPIQVPRRWATSKFFRNLPPWLQWVEPIGAFVTTLASLKWGFLATIPAVISAAFRAPFGARRAMVREARAWDYLASVARSAPVLLAVDGVQFLPASVLFEINAMFASAGKRFRLIFVERTNNDNKNYEEDVDVALEPLPREESAELLRLVLPSMAELPAAAIVDAANGNPKRLWMQVKSIGMNPEAVYSGLNYEEIIDELDAHERLMLFLVSQLKSVAKWILVNVLHQFYSGRVTNLEIQRSLENLVRRRLLRTSGALIESEHELVRIATMNGFAEADKVDDVNDSLARIMLRMLPSQKNLADTEALVTAILALRVPASPELVANLLPFIQPIVARRYAAASFDFIVTLAEELPKRVIAEVPGATLAHILHAFQICSQFQHGLSMAHALGDDFPRLANSRTLNLYIAKYHAQLFEYNDARNALAKVSDGVDKDAVEFNIRLNRCEDAEARTLVTELVKEERDLPFDNLMMLRNTAHLFDLSEAQRILEIANSGFRKIGDDFSSATAYNNLGVAQASSGDLASAEACFHRALDVFDRVFSGERYQPLNNLAVVAAANGQRERAALLLADAREAVSQSLQMDRLMLDFNDLMLAARYAEVDESTLLARLTEIHRESIVATRDRRFQWALAWIKEQVADGDVASTRFAREIRPRNWTGLELYFPLRLSSRMITAFFELSPHWRY